MRFLIMAHGHRCSLSLLLWFLSIFPSHYTVCVVNVHYHPTVIWKMIVSIIIVCTTILIQDSKHLMRTFFLYIIFNAVHWFLTYYQLLAEMAFWNKHAKHERCSTYRKNPQVMIEHGSLPFPLRNRLNLVILS